MAVAGFFSFFPVPLDAPGRPVLGLLHGKSTRSKSRPSQMFSNLAYLFYVSPLRIELESQSWFFIAILCLIGCSYIGPLYLPIHK